MPKLKQALADSDPALLPLFAKVWGVKNDALMDNNELIDSLAKAMLDPARTERVWETLDEKQRGALFMLMSGTGKDSGKMLIGKFEPLFGTIRKMGPAQIERDQPHIKGSVAEGLFYKGLIAQGFEKADKGAGARTFVYVPSDLLKVLPTHKTQYENLEDEAADDVPHEDIQVQPLTQVKNARNADTSAIDDLTTLLAYLQLKSPLLETDPRSQRRADYRLPQADHDAVSRYLLTPGDERLTFLLGLALAADLVDVQGGRAQPKRAEARRWLEATRSEQVKRLVEAWQSSQVYRELWHVPGLYPEPGGALDSYDPAAVRQAVCGFLEDLVPEQGWWSIDAFISGVKETEPDFERPGGVYDSWYIRNEAGEYLRGFESWDAVEGALLEFYLLGPMHWLGLMDVAEDAARLTVYGRAFMNKAAWPTPPEPSDKVIVNEDGTLLVSRKVARIDRFQVARFTSWGTAGDPYAYKIDARGINQAAGQSITPAHIGAFVSKALDGAPIPPAIAKLLETWQRGPMATATLEQLLVLRTTSPEVMNTIWDTPALRRYLGARLGEMAVIVRADQWEALNEALGEQGIQLEIVQ